MMASCEQEQFQHDPVKTKNKQQNLWATFQHWWVISCWVSPHHWQYVQKQLKFQHRYFHFAVVHGRCCKDENQKKLQHVRKIYLTPPLQKSTITSPGLASFFTAATKLFNCCCFLRARSLDIFPGDNRENIWTVMSSSQHRLFQMGNSKAQNIWNWWLKLKKCLEHLGIQIHFQLHLQILELSLCLHKTLQRLLLMHH